MFITESVEYSRNFPPTLPSLSQKRAVFPAFSSSEVMLGQMHKIGIHVIIYPNFVQTSHVALTSYY